MGRDALGFNNRLLEKNVSCVQRSGSIGHNGADGPDVFSTT